MPISEQELQEIEARERAATEGPWVYMGDSGGICWGEIRSCANFNHITDTPAGDERDNDMEFIAHAREDIPKLIAVVREIPTPRGAVYTEGGPTHKRLKEIQARIDDGYEPCGSKEFLTMLNDFHFVLSMVPGPIPKTEKEATHAK